MGSRGRFALGPEFLLEVRVLVGVAFLVLLVKRGDACRRIADGGGGHREIEIYRRSTATPFAIVCLYKPVYSSGKGMRVGFSVIAFEQGRGGRVAFDLVGGGIEPDGLAALTGNHPELDGRGRLEGLLDGTRGLDASPDGIEKLGHVQATQVGLGLVGNTLLVFAPGDLDPAVIGGKDGALFAKEEDAVGHLGGVFLGAPDDDAAR